MDDSLWRNALLSHRLLEGARADENLGWEQELIRLIGFGVYDCNDPGHPSWRSDVRSMRHASGMVLILWTILQMQKEGIDRIDREVLLMSRREEAREERIAALESELSEKTVLLYDQDVAICGLQKQMEEIIAKLNDRDRTIADDLVEVDRRLNRHRQSMNVTRNQVGWSDQIMTF